MGRQREVGEKAGPPLEASFFLGGGRGAIENMSLNERMINFTFSFY
jgi:hypothetical protein